MCCEIEKFCNGCDVLFYDVLGVLVYWFVDISCSL